MAENDAKSKPKKFPILRRLLLPGLLGSAVGVPFVYDAMDVSGLVEQAGNFFTEEESDADDKLLKGLVAEAQERATEEQMAEQQDVPTLVGEPVQNLAEVLRFDISRHWITSRWSRVSTTMSGLELEGLRVPLVTGTETNDLAGSLTYYFDKQQQVRRITFHGYTGDEHKLVDLVGSQFGLRREPALGAGLYLAKWNGRPTSVLRVSNAPIIRANQPRSQLQILLEINRPDMHYGLSPEVAQLLKLDKGANRW